MRKMTMITALLSSVMPIAFDNETGWKKDADGKLAVDADGNPIYVNAGGAEQSVKGDTIANLNSEAKNHRTAKEKAESDLAKYRDGNGKLIDPDAAKKAISDMSKIDAKQLIDAGKVDELKEQMKGEFTAQLNEKDGKISELTNANKALLTDKQFDGSEFIAKQIAIPRDIFRDSFGKYVKISDDGKPEYYDRDGNRLMSKKNAGEYATGDEAFELMVNMHPQKDTLLKAPDAGGSGNQGGGGGTGGSRTMKRADFDALDPGAKANMAASMAKGELTVVD